MSHELSLIEIKKEWHGTFKSYVIGFLGAIVLTLISFSLVIFELLSGNTLLWSLISLAAVQAVFQLLFFLHIGQEAKPRWESLIFAFMLLMLLIIVIGTLWVMSDLNSRVMSHMQGMQGM